MQAAPPPPLQPRKSGFPTWAIVLIGVIGALFIVLPIMAVLGIYGVRKYLANAKQAEAMNALGQIAKDAAAAYEADHPGPGGPISHRLCPSASRSVPGSLSMVSGMKYQSSTADWKADCGSDRGFCCLKFSMEVPQYYMYSYGATATEFTGRANGDLNGDGIASTFTIRGAVVGSNLQIAPNIEERNPGE
jgi:type IV pilus assembly protein PilA